MSRSPDKLNVWRVIAAFLIAPFAGALLIAIFFPLWTVNVDRLDSVLWTTWGYGLVGGYPGMVFLGIPAFFILRPRVRFSLFNCIVVGAVVAVLPWMAFGMVEPLGTIDMQEGNFFIFENGVRTWWGWLKLVELYSWIIVAGAVGGAAFWMIAAAGRRPHADADSDAPSENHGTITGDAG